MILDETARRQLLFSLSLSLIETASSSERNVKESEDQRISLLVLNTYVCPHDLSTVTSTNVIAVREVFSSPLISAYRQCARAMNFANSPNPGLMRNARLFAQRYSLFLIARPI